jgi:TolB-like protein
MNRRTLRLLAGVLASGVAAAPAAHAEKVRVVVLGITASDPKLKQLADSIGEQTLTELSRERRLDPIGTSDVATVLGLERQKQMLGCSDQSASCLAEISAALGAPWLVTGNLAKAGKATRVDLKLIRARDGKAVFRDGRNFKDESEMFDLVSSMVKALVASMDLPPEAPVVVADAPKKAEGTTSTPAPVPQPEARALSVEAPVAKPGPGVLPWVVAGGGVLVAGVGTFLYVISDGTRNANLSADHKANNSYSVVRAEVDSSTGFMQLGGTLIGVGALGAVGGLAWALLGGPAPAPVVVAPTANGVSVGGAF